MEFDQWDPNAPIICPYDPLHVISAKRFQRHLIKCRKNHPHLDFVSCPFNAKHMFHRSELKQHIALCPDRKPLDPDIQQEKDDETGENYRLKGDTSLPVSRYREPIHNDEDWEPEIQENIARKEEARERALRDFIPRLREPHFSFEEKDVHQTMIKRNLACPNPLDGYCSDESDFSISSKSSSLYVEPIKGNIKNQTYKAENNRSLSEAQKMSRGRGLLGLLQSRNSERPLGRGSVHALLKENIRKPTSIPQGPVCIGRGSVRQAAIQPSS